MAEPDGGAEAAVVAPETFEVDFSAGDIAPGRQRVVGEHRAVDAHRVGVVVLDVARIGVQVEGPGGIDLAAGASGEPEEILSDLPRAASPGQWGLCRDGVVTVGSGDGGAVIAMLVFDSGEILDLARIPEPSSIAIGVAPDCGAVLLGSTERGSSDLMVANL